MTWLSQDPRNANMAQAARRVPANHGLVEELLAFRPDLVIAGSFTTRNTHVPGRQIGMRLVKGPFSKLEGDWSFQPVGDGTQGACRVGLELRYGFSSMALGAVVGPVFDRIAGSLVDAFVKRAEQVYGG